MLEILKPIIDDLIRDNPEAGKAYEAMINRGLPEAEAKRQIGAVFVAVSWEVWHGYPDRLAASFEALRAGRSAEEIFPDDAYDQPAAGSA